MGPPLFAPLLFGTSAYLGVIASYLQREEDYGLRSRVVAATTRLHKQDFRDDIRTGRFQKHLCAVAAVWTVCSGMESWYSHYKDNFKYKVQWSPILLTPLMLAATLGARRSKRLANTALPAVSALLMLDGTIGFGYHMRGILRRPAGKKKPLYNILYGPPIFAPLLVAACGLLGMMAYLMRRER
jgi:muramidase (phage lysozyme)